MSTNVTWNGTTYAIPASGETGWSALSTFLIALGNGAAVTEEMKQAMRVATTTPVTVSATTDCVVATKLAAPGAVAVNLPAGVNGQMFAIVDQLGDAATNNITITPNGAETINGAATYVMNQNNESVILAYSSTNTKWNVVARFTAGAPLTNPMAVTGDMIYSVGTVPTKLATGATAGFLVGGNGAVPAWRALVTGDIPTTLTGKTLTTATLTTPVVSVTSTDLGGSAAAYSATDQFRCGRYTATYTNVANTSAAVTPTNQMLWSQTGLIVTCNGYIQVTVTAGAPTVTTFTLTLPVTPTSNFDSSTNAAGTVTYEGGTTSLNPGYVYGNASAKTVTITFAASASGSSRQISYSFQYKLN